MAQDLWGWAATTSAWTDIHKALGTASKSDPGIGGPAGSTSFTDAGLPRLSLCLQADAPRANVGLFILVFTVPLLSSLLTSPAP